MTSKLPWLTTATPHICTGAMTRQVCSIRSLIGSINRPYQNTIDPTSAWNVDENQKHRNRACPKPIHLRTEQESKSSRRIRASRRALVTPDWEACIIGGEIAAAIRCAAAPSRCAVSHEGRRASSTVSRASIWMVGCHESSNRSGMRVAHCSCSPR